MSRTPSLTAKELSITPNELRLLEATETALNNLKGCVVIDIPHRNQKRARLGFSMFHVLLRRGAPNFSRSGFDDKRNKGCNTVGCIAGWMEALSKGSFRIDTSSSRLRSLFYPSNGIYNWEKITPRVAARAIKRFRTTNVIDFEGRGVKKGAYL